MSSLFFGNVLWRKGMKLSILITLLNEELVLAQTHAAISAQLEDMLGKDLSDYEILYIDDGSNDRTFELIAGIARDNNRVKYIRFSRNFGRESGILAGFKYATSALSHPALFRGLQGRLRYCQWPADS